PEAAPAVLARQGPHRVGPAFVDLQEQRAARLEQRGRARQQAARRLQPVVAAHQRRARLVLRHRRIERRVLGDGQIRRVRDDHAAALTRQRRQQVAIAYLDRRGGGGALHVLPRQRGRTRRSLHGDHAVEETLDREREGETAA